MSSYQDFWRTLPITAALNKFTLVKDNGAGQWIPVTKGMAADAVMTTTSDATMATALYPLAGELLMRGKIRVLQASGAIAIGATVYSDDGGLITAVNTGWRVGMAIEAATANGDQIAVALDPGAAAGFSVLSAPTAAAAGKNAEFVLATITLPANSLVVGDVIDIQAMLVATGNGADTSQVRIRLGGLTGTVIADTTAVATVAANTPVDIAAQCVVEVLGNAAAGKVDAGSRTGFFKAGFAPISAGQVALDTTVAQTIVLTITHGTNNVANTIVANQFTAKRLRAA